MSVLTSAIAAKAAVAALSLAALGGGTAVAVAVQAAPAPSAVTSTTAVSPTATPTVLPSSDATPTPDPTAAPTAAPTTGPDADGHSAFGLCKAFAAGGLAPSSAAYGALVTASKAAGGIHPYCAPIFVAHHCDPSTGRPDPTASPAARDGSDEVDRGSRSGGDTDAHVGPVPVPGVVTGGR